MEASQIQKALLSAHVRGRIEMVPVSDQFTLLIDYAHNAMSLKSLLTTLKEYEPGGWSAYLAVEETVPDSAAMKWERSAEIMRI